MADTIDEKWSNENKLLQCGRIQVMIVYNQIQRVRVRLGSFEIRDFNVAKEPNSDSFTTKEKMRDRLNSIPIGLIKDISKHDATQTLPRCLRAV